MREHGHWTSMDEHGQAWTNIDEHGRTWTNMDEHERTWDSLDILSKYRFYFKYFNPTCIEKKLKFAQFGEVEAPETFDFYYNSFCLVFPKKLGRFFFRWNFMAILSDQV